MSNPTATFSARLSMAPIAEEGDSSIGEQRTTALASLSLLDESRQQRFLQEIFAFTRQRTCTRLESRRFS